MRKLASGANQIKLKLAMSSIMVYSAEVVTKAGSKGDFIQTNPVVRRRDRTGASFCFELVDAIGSPRPAQVSVSKNLKLSCRTNLRTFNPPTCSSKAAKLVTDSYPRKGRRRAGLRKSS